MNFHEDRCLTRDEIYFMRAVKNILGRYFVSLTQKVFKLNLISSRGSILYIKEVISKHLSIKAPKYRKRQIILLGFFTLCIPWNPGMTPVELDGVPQETKEKMIRHSRKHTHSQLRLEFKATYTL